MADVFTVLGQQLPDPADPSLQTIRVVART